MTAPQPAADPANPPVFFIRHGETDWNKARRYQGHSDIPLNDTGRGQARRNGEVLRARMEAEGLDPQAFAYVASPLSRARETMEIVRRGLGLDPAGYTTDKRLMEIDFGAWNGAVIEDLAHRFPDLAAQRLAMPWTFVPPDGESYEQLYARVDAAVREIGGPTVIVAHGGVSRVLRGAVIGLTPDEMMKLAVPQDRIFEVRHGSEEML